MSVYIICFFKAFFCIEFIKCYITFYRTNIQWYKKKHLCPYFYFQYPFLNKIWDLYESFDNSVEGRFKTLYDSICTVATKSLDDDKTKYHNICMKIIRNLDPNCENQEGCISHSTRCNNVNIWLYNYKDKKNLNKKYIIEGIFQLSRTFSTVNKTYECPYYSYDENFEEPINIILLKMFDYNTDIIKSTLENERDPNYSSAQRYLCKFVELHKKMYSSYCPKKLTKSDKENRTCDELGTLKNSYNIFRLLYPQISPKIPSLEATKEELLDICPSIQAEHSLQASVDGHSGSSTSKIPATIGTMAGVSSVFALLYKVNTKFYLNV
ncbi:hypothetical protein PVIIG_06516 [Plasmodium vivax India VII]|uniref:Variable surface protein n=1 Tax=Plasmodium vivax India VII TaxID=1077284 RepID=A0A0J9S1D1_PLAVI|nr:hypothetical protein PVIIG_06516 [Plasmodium vivax India VII]